MTQAIECTNCGRRSFYKKRCCLDCGGGDFTTVPAGEGQLRCLTTVNVTPPGVPNPNYLGLASFAGSANIIAQAEGYLSVGDTVRLDADRDIRLSSTGMLRGCRLVAVD